MTPADMTKEQALERVRRWEATHSRRFDATYAKGSSTPEDAKALAYIEKALADYERARPLLEAAKRAKVHGMESGEIAVEFDDPEAMRELLGAAIAYKESSHD